MYRILAAVAPPKVGEDAPEWASNFSVMMGWAAWFALGICVIGVIVTGGAMAIANRRGEGGEHATKLGWVMMGCLIVGSASGIVQAMIKTAG